MRFVVAFGVLAAILVAGCGGGGGDGAKVVDVALKEWSVTPSIGATAAGKVKFSVKNEGTISHEFVIVKSDLPPEGLPLLDGKVVEEQVNKVDELEALGAGTTESITLDLSPGKYLLICNIVELPPGQKPVSHYQNGMVAFFQVGP